MGCCMSKKATYTIHNPNDYMYYVHEEYNSQQNITWRYFRKKGCPEYRDCLAYYHKTG